LAKRISFTYYCLNAGHARLLEIYSGTFHRKLNAKKTWSDAHGYFVSLKRETGAFFESSDHTRVGYFIVNYRSCNFTVATNSTPFDDLIRSAFIRGCLCSFSARLDDRSDHSLLSGRGQETVSLMVYFFTLHLANLNQTCCMAAQHRLLSCCTRRENAQFSFVLLFDSNYCYGCIHTYTVHIDVDLRDTNYCASKEVRSCFPAYCPVYRSCVHSLVVGRTTLCELTCRLCYTKLRRDRQLRYTP
jgi:hypothetical protein